MTKLESRWNQWEYSRLSDLEFSSTTISEKCDMHLCFNEGQNPPLHVLMCNTVIIACIKVALV